MLDELAIKYKCDKSSIEHNYVEIYSVLFEPFRLNEINLLEVGVCEGPSIRVWREYFPKANIYGWDIRNKYLNTIRNIERVFPRQVDQSNKQQLKDGAKLDGPFDLVIDDGSHEGPHQILTFETLWPHVKPNGYYIVEDVNCSYHEKWAGTKITDNFIVYAKDIIDDLNFYGRHDPNPNNRKGMWWCNVNSRTDASQRQKEIFSILFHPGLVIIRKREKTYE